MRKFGRKKAHRMQMLKNLATSVILYESIQTTAPKAKETRSIIDKMINTAKIQTLQSRRELLAYFTDKNAIKKIYEVLIDRFKETKGGYTKIYKYGYRIGDGSQKVILRLSKLDIVKDKINVSTKHVDNNTKNLKNKSKENIKENK